MVEFSRETIIDAKSVINSVLTSQLSLETAALKGSDVVKFKVSSEYPKTVEEIDYETVVNPDTTTKNVPHILVTIARIRGNELMRAIGSIILGSSVETTGGIGSSNSLRGFLVNDAFEIAIWSRSSKLRDLSSILIRQILFEKQDYFLQEEGFIKWIYAGIQDNEVDIGKIPRTIYRGALSYLAAIPIKQGSKDSLVQQIITEIKFMDSQTIQETL